MKALVWEAAKTLTIRDIPVPNVPDDEVLIKVAHVGICGSELSGFLGHNALRVPPIVMGHEFAGEIVELGKAVSSIRLDLAEHQRVTVNPLNYCGNCELCLRGLNQLCVKRQLLGAHRPGAFAEYIAVPAQLVSLLPDSMPTRIGALTEPAGCGVRIGELAGDVAGAECLIIGAGPIGLLSLQVFQLKGAQRIYLAEIDPERLKMAVALGAIGINPKETNTVDYVREQTNGRGVQVAVDAVGTEQTRKQCVQSLVTTGTLICSGLHEESSPLPVAEIIRREITVRGAFAYSPADFAQALDYLADDKIKLDPYIIEAPLEDGQSWFERLIDAPGNVAKVLLVP